MIVEIRRDADGEYYDLVTAWKATQEEEQSYVKTRISADEIAEKASRGENISAYFTNNFSVVRPVRRVNVDLTPGMLRQLDECAARLNVSRQSVIKTLLSRAFGGRTDGPARRARKAGSHCLCRISRSRSADALCYSLGSEA